MIYLTWGIGFNGIFSSQVVGVCKYLSKIKGKSITLVSFVPYPGYWETRRRIKKSYLNSIIIPMIPSRNHWWPIFSMLIIPIVFFYGRKRLITRGVIANQIALMLRRIGITKSVVYDGRGALKAEWTEYDIVRDDRLVSKIGRWESEAVNKSDFQLAVSNKLVKYWEDEFNYKGKQSEDYVVVPCTVNADVFQKDLLKSNELRLKYNYSEDDVILVYSGSAESWQSFTLIDDFLKEVLSNNDKIKVLFMAKIDLDSLGIYNSFKDRIRKMWVDSSEVSKVLSICDYGLLIRENTVTNQVASPTKFAEYLASGLKVIISNNVGDFSQVVFEQGLGIVLNSRNESLVFERPNTLEKERIINFSRSNFQKPNFNKEYKLLIGDNRY